MSRLGVFVLDTAAGTPAEGVEVRLEVGPSHDPTVLDRGVTAADGCIDGFGSGVAWPGAGEARLVYETGAYFQGRGLPSTFPRIEVELRLAGEEPVVVLPLLVSPHGYSTYRGSP